MTFGNKISKVWLNKWSRTFWFVLDLSKLTIHVKSVFKSNSFISFINEFPIKVIYISNFLSHFRYPLRLEALELLVLLIKEAASQKVLLDYRLIHVFVIRNYSVWCSHKDWLTFVLFNYRIFRFTVTLDFYYCTVVLDEFFLNILIKYCTATLLLILIFFELLNA